MKRVEQTLDDLFSKLTTIETDWKDDFSDRLVVFINEISENEINKEVLITLLEKDYELGITVFRLFLEKSKDEFNSIIKEISPASGKKYFLKNKDAFIETLFQLRLREIMDSTILGKYTWKNIIIERLKAGRGSAIKGQQRGRQTENFVEDIVKAIFTNYDPRCSFTGKTGLSTEKADFAIPSKEKPNILIEVKAYGATGSKQTDVIGDITRIIKEKRTDTYFLLFTDGITWKSRANDFRKLIKFQNEGDIYKIYTKSMIDELIVDLKTLKKELRIS
jgi:hypothetical protein